LAVAILGREREGSVSKILLGKTPEGKWVEVDLEVLLRSRLLVQANSGGGKSVTLRLLIEQLFGKVQIIVIDREGEFPSLCDEYDFLLVGQGHDIPASINSARLLAEKLLELRASAIIDLYEAFRTSTIGRLHWVRDFLMGLVDAPKNLWHDVVVIVDEAHLFCPEATPKAADMRDREIIQGCKEAMIALATVGRKRGQCAVWATQRLAKLDKDASAELMNRLVGMTMEDTDVDRAIDLMSVSREDRPAFRKSLRELEPGNFYVFGRAITKERTLFKVTKPKTHHDSMVGGLKGIYEPPPPSEKLKTLLAKLGDLPKEVEAKARTEKQLREENQALRTQLGQARRQAEIIADLRAKLAQSASKVAPGPVTKEVKVEVPVIREAELKRLEKIADKMSDLSGRVSELGKGIGLHLADLVDRAHRLGKAPPLAAPKPHRGFRGEPVPPLHLRPAPPVRTPKNAPERSIESSDAGDPLSNPQLRQLQGLAELEAVGIKRVPRKMLAGWLGLKLSGSFKNNFMNLRQRGLVDYADQDLVLTDAGRQAAPSPELEVTNAAVLERCCKALSGPQEKQLRYLHQAYPNWVGREELAEALGLTMSGSFKNNFMNLHAAEMIEYGTGEHRNMLRCAPWLFVEEGAPAV
jgi:Helicase HerA, central domain